MGNDCKAVGIEHFLYDDRDPNKWAPEGHIHYNVESQLSANFDRYDNHPEKMNSGAISIKQDSFETMDFKKMPNMMYAILTYHQF